MLRRLWPQPPPFIPEQRTPGRGATGPQRGLALGVPFWNRSPEDELPGDGLGLIILPNQEQRALCGGAERTRKWAGSSGTQGTYQSRRNREATLSHTLTSHPLALR